MLSGSTQPKRGYSMAKKYEVQFIKDYTYTLKGDIEVTEFNGTVQTIKAPDFTYNYPVGRRVTFKTKKEAKEFVAGLSEYCQIVS